MKSVTLEFTYKKKEIIGAFRLHYCRILSWKIGFLVVIFEIILAIIFQIYIEDMLFGMGFIFLGIFVLFFYIIIFGIKPHLVWNKFHKYRERYYLKFSLDKIVFKTVTINSELKWDIYDQLFESKKYLFLYQKSNIFTLLPKRAFKDVADIDILKQLFFDVKSIMNKRD